MRKTLKRAKGRARSAKANTMRMLRAEPFAVKSPRHGDDHFLNKRRSLVPKFARGAREELDKVKWPGRRQSISLTTAVYIFAGVFMLLASTADWGFSKIAERIFLK
jgi:preprotein translocase SecE subunit